MKSPFIAAVILHAGSMKISLVIWLVLLQSSVLSWSEMYRSVAMSDLRFEAAEGEVAEAMTQRLDSFGLNLLDVRLATEGYLDLEDLEVAKLPQKELRLVIKGNDKLPMKGAVDLVLDESRNEAKTFRFTIPQGAAEEIEEKDFLKVQQAWAERRALMWLPGRVWFNHLAREEMRRASMDPVDLMRTFDLFSGGRAIADNLALNRDLILAGEKNGKTVGIDTIKGVTVKPIDWTEYVPKAEVPVDFLSLAIPEDQHAVFAPSLHGLIQLMKRFEAEATPLLGLSSSESSYRQLLKRYRRQLGLDFGDGAVRLLPIKTIAVTGGTSISRLARMWPFSWRRRIPQHCSRPSNLQFTPKSGKSRRGIAKARLSGCPLCCRERVFSAICADWVTWYLSPTRWLRCDAWLKWRNSAPRR